MCECYIHGWGETEREEHMANMYRHTRVPGNRPGVSERIILCYIRGSEIKFPGYVYKEGVGAYMRNC